MRADMLNKQTLANLVLIALTIVAVPSSRAECGTVAHNASTLSPQLKSLQKPAAQGEESDSDQADLPNATVTVLGLWKKVYFDEQGVLNDIGLAQFNAGGTELLNDVGAFNAGSNFCTGVWKKVGPGATTLCIPSISSTKITQRLRSEFPLKHHIWSSAATAGFSSGGFGLASSIILVRTHYSLRSIPEHLRRELTTVMYGTRQN